MSTEVSLRRALSDLIDEPLILEKTSLSGFLGWLAIVVGVVAYDAYAIKTKRIETLTKFFWRTTEKPIIGSITVGVWLGLTFHLLIEKSLRKLFQN
jgi:hypothetical protein